MTQPFKLAHLGNDPLPRRKVWRRTLPDNASLPSLPFLAQRAIIELEHAATLAGSLDVFETDAGRAPDQYQEPRLARTSKVVPGSSENAGRFHNPGLADVTAGEDDLENESEPEKVKLWCNWLFEYAAATAYLEVKAA